MIDASITAAAYCAEPLSTNEIDAHPDAARIWATIQSLRDTHADELDAVLWQLDEYPDVDAILDIQFVLGICDNDVTMVADYAKHEPDREFHDAINDALDDVLPRLKVLFSMLNSADR